ncbi:hypothetical protein LQ564_22065 [Massilia sp. G4R7]|uniref:Uncharacterized protein n=1 Tax=Massilia phyllostachyos TaxID=2898585 RepID=A0ABS8QB74_9BURK|nr:hypothetical protein [Massilia phyllostachyos]MCD2518991.1 hypothetical protein [Massilia phyllostachyos]
MPASYKLIFRISFGHAFFADGILRDLRMVPVPVCFDKLRRAGLELRAQEDGIAVYGDEKAIARLRLHIGAAGRSLGMAFQVFFTDPHFFEYTAPSWPSGKLLFLDTADSVTDDSGRRIVHATPFVEASAFLERDHARLTPILGERVLAPTPAMVIQVDLSAALLDVVDARQRHFHIRFDAASGHWNDGKQGSGDARPDDDPARDITFRHFAGVNIADRRRAHLFLAKGAIQMREVSPPRLRLRPAPHEALKAPANRMAAAGVG